MVVELAKSQPVADIAEQVGEHGTRPWRLIRHYADETRPYEDCTGVETIGIDETSRRGHRCITVVADLTERNVICVVPGKDPTTAKRFADDFMAHDGDPDRVRPVTCDMGPGFAKGHPRPFAQRGQNHRRVPCRQTRQRGRRQGPQGRGQGERPAEKDEVPVARERVQPHGPAAGGQARSGEAAVEDRQGVRDARTPAGHPRRQRQPHEGGGRVQGIALVDDAFAAETDEGPRRTVPPALAGHPRLLRPSVRQRDPRGTERHHPARQDPLPRLQEHGLLRHHDLPDLRQTRPQHRHRLTRFTHTKQRKAIILTAPRAATSRGLARTPLQYGGLPHCERKIQSGRNQSTL